ncbi:MAG: HAMP domain-containing histidine kinase, partial [Candidatus Nomurabacteria bacterium]|nr:HAMP domain-containing histidine kinase [Candidatus Nomurabacteria bacterium]
MTPVINKAILKLSAILTAVLMLTSIGFSVAVYNLAVGEVERPAPTEINRRPDFEIIFRNRNREIRANLLIKHVVANLIVLVFGAVGSYFLARWVLKPVAANMEAQARFVSDASHELRTPLTVMAMENETLLHSGATRRADLLKQIESNLEEVGKLRALTDNLLKLSLDEKLEISNLDLAEVADAACREISKSAAARKIVVKNQVKSSEISANRAALVEILVILLDNAIKYSPAGSVVVLSYHSGEISVRDS